MEQIMNKGNMLQIINCFDWFNSYNYCRAVLNNNNIPYNPNLLAAFLISAKQYSHLKEDELKQIIYGKEVVLEIDNLLHKQQTIYEEFIYEYQYEKIINILQHESVYENFFELNSLDGVLKAMYVFFFYRDKLLSFSNELES